MTRFQKIAFIGLLIAVAGLVYLEATKPVPINWSPSYVHTDKIPLGGFAFHKVLENALEDTLILSTDPPFKILKDSTFTGTYLFINDEVDFDTAEFDRLYEWVEKGNTLFVSANYISYKLKDTLGLETQSAWLRDRITTEPMLNLSNKKLKTQNPVHIERNLSITYFNEIDTLKQTVLGVSEPFNDTLKITKPNINFIKQSIGTGEIILHTQPEVFSNYFLLEKEENLLYTQNVLAYLDSNKPIYWDAHYKSGKPLNTSPLYLLLENRNFKWAYYLLIIGVVLFVLIEGKRKQRSIPIVKPHTNRTYEYTRTIAGMYYDKKDYKQISRKQISLFKEYIRTRLRINTQATNTQFAQQVASRSGNSIEDTNAILEYMNTLETKHTVTETELKELYQKISSFKQYTYGTHRNTK